jgi:hypothetical protein
MSLEHELRQLFERIEDAPWPGEPEAFDQFLRRKRRRGRVMAAAVVTGVLVIAVAASLVPALKPPSTDPLTPRPLPGPQLPSSTVWFKPTYVPAGFQLTRALEQPPTGPGLGFLPTAQSFRNAKGAGEFTVSVNPYLQHLDIDRVKRTYPGVQVVQVRGRSGVLFPLPPDSQQGQYRYPERLLLHNGLVWQEGPSIVIQVLGSSGLPDLDLFSVAESLRRIVVTRSGKVAITVGPRPPGWIRLARGGTPLDSMTVLPRSYSQQFSKPRDNHPTLVITETRDQYGPLRIPPQNIDATRESFSSVRGQPTTLLHDPGNHKLTLIWHEPGGIEFKIEADEVIGRRQLLAIAEGLQQSQG